MKKTNLSDYDASVVPDGSNYHIGIVVAEWNPEITDALLDGAYTTLLKHGVKDENIEVMHVPGSFELTTGAHILLSKRERMDAVICIGCVIQGETRHFDFICSAVAHGITNLSLQTGKPVIFSVLTTNTFEQAKARSGGVHGNKGIEGAVAALKMIRNNG